MISTLKWIRVTGLSGPTSARNDGTQKMGAVMDAQRFDAIARGFSSRVTRRRAVAGAIGLAAVGEGAGDAGAAARATCRAFGAGCIRSSQCCDGRCDTRRTTPRSGRNRCTCREGLVRCGGVCVDPRTNHAHCGACGNVCPAVEICDGGECVCEGDLGTDEHCSACGDACGSNQRCCNGACTDLGTASNCTACGDVCNGGQDELCLSAEDGCAYACDASTRSSRSGFFTTDNPPVFYPGTNINVVLYTDPTSTIFDVTPCTTSADCTFCADRLGLDYGVNTIAGCGCLQFDCELTEGGDLAGMYSNLGPQGNGYVCGLVVHATNWNPNA